MEHVCCMDHVCHFKCQEIAANHQAAIWKSNVSVFYLKKSSKRNKQTLVGSSRAEYINQKVQ